MYKRNMLRNYTLKSIALYASILFVMACKKNSTAIQVIQDNFTKNILIYNRLLVAAGGVYDGELLCYDANATFKWKLSNLRDNSIFRVIPVGGKIYTCNFYDIHCIDANSGAVIWKNTNSIQNGGIITDIFVRNDTLFESCYDDYANTLANGKLIMYNANSGAKLSTATLSSVANKYYGPLLSCMINGSNNLYSLNIVNYNSYVLESYNFVSNTKSWSKVLGSYNGNILFARNNRIVHINPGMSVNRKQSILTFDGSTGNDVWSKTNAKLVTLAGDNIFYSDASSPSGHTVYKVSIDNGTVLAQFQIAPDIFSDDINNATCNTNNIYYKSTSSSGLISYDHNGTLNWRISNLHEQLGSIAATDDIVFSSTSNTTGNQYAKLKMHDRTTGNIKDSIVINFVGGIYPMGFITTTKQEVSMIHMH